MLLYLYLKEKEGEKLGPGTEGEGGRLMGRRGVERNRGGDERGEMRGRRG